MALPGRQQTFAMDDCRDMLHKLEWEIDQLKDAVTKLDPMRLKCVCYNAAVTAWQLADWIIADATAEQKTALGIKRAIETEELGALQAKARDECRELYLCRQLATASKHRDVEFHFDPMVDAGIEIDDSGPDHFVAWDAFVDDHGTKRSAITIFERARDYWTGIIYQNKISA